MNDGLDTGLAFELDYFNETIAQAAAQLKKEETVSGENESRLISSRQELWEQTTHSGDYSRMAEFNQYLEPLQIQTASYLAGVSRIAGLRGMMESPYFARVDFAEEGDDETQRVYIGKSMLMDEEAGRMIVFDWRSPIASMFYRYEPGKAHYEAPKGTIRGEISLKRQYEIRNGKFEYFFDVNLQVEDEFLRRMLSQNASSRMKDIVETIQRDQDTIIRDTENGLLMVQGVAGSGKTSVALHRVAFLMYHGLASRLDADRIVIISPSNLFGQYISNVLPGLGEKNVQTQPFEQICAGVLDHSEMRMQQRNQYYEQRMSVGASGDRQKADLVFKTSAVFVRMIGRYLRRYERRMVPFTDIYYDNRMLVDRQTLQGMLHRRAGTPIALRLQQIEAFILEKVAVQRKERRVRLEQFIREYPTHVFEVKQYARLITIKESIALLHRLRVFTEPNYEALYFGMFRDKKLFYRLADGLELPPDIEQIRLDTAAMPIGGMLLYEDALALTYLKLQMTGGARREIRQVVVDEAQDYGSLHFEILNTLFPAAWFTVLGDINQTIDKGETMALYEQIHAVLRRDQSALLQMTKSFRCTREITEFSRRFLEESAVVEGFGRSGVAPAVVSCPNEAQLDQRILQALSEGSAQGYETIALLCKSAAEAKVLYERLQGRAEVRLLTDQKSGEIKGMVILPIYLSKGLEFDFVLVCGADQEHFSTEEDRKLLYIASTRALHRLDFYGVGRLSDWVEAPRG